MQMAEGSTLTGELFEDVAFPAISLTFLLVSILPVCWGATLMNWGGSGSVPIQARAAASHDRGDPGFGVRL